MTKRLASLVTLLVLAAASGACEFGDKGPPNPVPNNLSGSSSSGSGGNPEVQPVTRTVETRSPMGDIVGNLLLDGDFELSTFVQGQSPQAAWFGFDNNTQRYIRTETGGLCKSGLRCALLEPGMSLFGRGTAAADTGMVVSVWIKPPAGGDCTVASVTMIRCNFTGIGTPISSLGSEPDAQGWCHYRGNMAETNTATCMLIDGSTLSGDEPALVDAAAVLPDDGTAPRQLMKPLSSAKQARYHRMSRHIRGQLPIGQPPAPKLPIGDL